MYIVSLDILVRLIYSLQYIQMIIYKQRQPNCPVVGLGPIGCERIISLSCI